MSERKILELVQSAGIEISAGTVSNLLTASRTAFTTEAREVLQAGLESTPYHHRSLPRRRRGYEHAG